ncbi:MAG: hypothetical protein KFB96_03215 [Thiocapsa sp.]|uniref:hypothetical protein n=1 Tax=Thiocapsa sp. TaxID=2024551 RepID=UPI001BCAA69F|nr:hypothetical protein [Thiocapsa sp.]QVL49537.1 MAG: hypothetical protein KFB96_03215 [Thiocapsa sp.]
MKRLAGSSVNWVINGKFIDVSVEFSVEDGAMVGVAWDFDVSPSSPATGSLGC